MERILSLESRDNSDIIEIIKGSVDPSELSVYTIIFNELFFLPAFLNHYRSLGIKQFIILDDRSYDGSRDFLMQQNDVVVLTSKYRYSEKINGIRAVHYWKNFIPHTFFGGQWSICVDADEFIQIPPRFKSFEHLLGRLDALGITAVGAAMVDFYPRTISDMKRNVNPNSLVDLSSYYGWFDVGPYFNWYKDNIRPKFIQGSVRERLFQKYAIHKRSIGASVFARFKLALIALFRKDINFKSIHKVPLVKWTKGSEYLHSHTLNRSPDPRILLSIMHFKFTERLYEKIRAAIEMRSHSKNSRDYVGYSLLIRKMELENGEFIDECSRKFESVNDLVKANLLIDHLP